MRDMPGGPSISEPTIIVQLRIMPGGITKIWILGNTKNCSTDNKIVNENRRIIIVNVNTDSAEWLHMRYSWVAAAYWEFGNAPGIVCRRRSG
jgi:hypothetical protein